MIDTLDPDVRCLLCGERRFSGCTCPKHESTLDEIEFSRESRLVRAELATAAQQQLGREAKR